MAGWQFDFEEYIKQGEPDKKEKTYAWKTAIGLQDVDALKPSEYLIRTAKAHIEGDIDIYEAKDRLENRLEYEKLYRGRYHAEKKIDKLKTMFKNMEIFCECAAK